TDRGGEDDPVATEEVQSYRGPVRCSRAARAALLRCPQTPSASVRARARGLPPNSERLVLARPHCSRTAGIRCPWAPAASARALARGLPPNSGCLVLARPHCSRTAGIRCPWAPAASARALARGLPRNSRRLGRARLIRLRAARAVNAVSCVRIGRLRD